MTDSAATSILAPALPNPTKQPRQVFVAYSYRLYRKIYRELAGAFNIEFIFADKIANYIRSSRLGIYDISGWNANVTLERGLAFGPNGRAFIAIDPISIRHIQNYKKDWQDCLRRSFRLIQSMMWRVSSRSCDLKR